MGLNGVLDKRLSDALSPVGWQVTTTRCLVCNVNDERAEIFVRMPLNERCVSQPLPFSVTVLCNSSSAEGLVRETTCAVWSCTEGLPSIEHASTV